MPALRGALSTLPTVAVMAALLLLPAGLLQGVWTWPEAWVFVAVVGTASATANALMATLRPDSYRVRRQGYTAWKKRQPLIDAVGLPVYMGVLLGWLAFIPLDVFRFHLAPAPTPAIEALGASLTLAGLAIAYVAIAQNRFAAPTIHDQGAEGQEVIQSGLYGVVRHPFYAGMLLVYPGTALWLGSYAAAIGSVAFLALTLARIVVEERYLRDQLADYADYARRVRFRLIPTLL